jgi:hypothetical protein
MFVLRTGRSPRRGAASCRMIAATQHQQGYDGPGTLAAGSGLRRRPTRHRLSGITPEGINPGRAAGCKSSLTVLTSTETRHLPSAAAFPSLAVSATKNYLFGGTMNFRIHRRMAACILAALLVQVGSAGPLHQTQNADDSEERSGDRQITILQTTDLHHHANGADHVGLPRLTDRETGGAAFASASSRARSPSCSRTRMGWYATGIAP